MDGQIPTHTVDISLAQTMPPSGCYAPCTALCVEFVSYMLHAVGG